ncbi:hypothetical protein D3C79_1011950 [compost metagenome]
MGELGRAVLIGCMGDVVELVLDEGAELSVGALGAVVGGQGDEVGRLVSKPFPHLLLLPSLLPPACAEHQLLGLAENYPPA